MASKHLKRLKQRPAFYVAWKLILILISSLVISLAVYGLSSTVQARDGVAISLSVLFAIPFLVGAWGAYIFDPHGKRGRGFYASFPVFLILAVLFFGAIILKEGVICVIMLLPIWGFSAWMGAVVVKRLHKEFRARYENNRLFASSFILIPLFALMMDNTLPMHTEYRTITRSIIINSPPEAVWPVLHRIENIQDTEGRWNITQDVLGVPRPRAAVINGEGIGAIRESQWGEFITFQEHITKITPNAALEWDFVFLDDSLQNHTDKHISPDGQNLTIKTGGYHLFPHRGGRSKLVLYTNYRMTTPVNSYSALWGEFILGDIQNNILTIVKTRTEAVNTAATKPSIAMAKPR